MSRKLFQQKKTLVFLMTLVILGVFIFGNFANASLTEEIGNVIGVVIGWLISGVGLILILVMKVLVIVAQYSNFINAPAVVNGWVTVRDICNMFFVVILLLIAFATILRIENYSYKKWLPKLILMAILINFSKTICGLLIDVAQVVMLTFVNAFKDVAGGNLIDMMGLKDIVTLARASDDVGFWAIVGSYILGLIYIVLALIVITAMLAMLVMRIVMIWIYVVLSPLAYLLSAFPGGASYASKWWSEFTKNLIVGPVLAFFIWLSFVSMQGADVASQGFVGASTEVDKQALTDSGFGGVATGLSDSTSNNVTTNAGTTDVFIKFIVSIGMLLGGMKIAQEIGGSAAGVAGSVFSKGKKLAIGAGLGAGFLALKGAKQPISWGVDKLHEKSGVDLNLKRSWSVMQAKRKENQEKRYTQGQIAAGQAMESGGRLHGILAMTGNSGDAWDQMTSWKGVAKRLKGGRRMQRLKDESISDKQEAVHDFNEKTYQNDFVNADSEKRFKMRDEAVTKVAATRNLILKNSKAKQDLDNQIKTEEAKAEYADPNKLKILKEKKEKAEENLEESKFENKKWTNRAEYAEGNLNKNFSDQEKFEARNAVGLAESKVAKHENKIESNTPEYNFEARAAEQHAVAHEAAKIKDVSDPSELLRIMKDAIKAKDKTMVKAIALKMTKDANDNEFLKPLVGRTDHVGLNKLMREFSDSHSENYAGFNQQEAFALGSQIAELNKNTNHWGASSAYKMENGQWRETTDKEHHEIRHIETGKQQLQAFIRNNNRLAYGYHDETGEFHLDAGGVIKLQSINNSAGFKNLETMNESAAQYVYDAIKANPKLEDEFKMIKKNADGKEVGSLLTNLEARLGTIAAQNFETRYDQVNAQLD